MIKMYFEIKSRGFAFIEFFLSILALFLLLITTYPIFQDLMERSQRIQIQENLYQIRNYSEKYFQDNVANSVSLYEFTGPRKAISELKIIADEDYPKIIFRNKGVSAYSEKYGIISVK